MAGRYFASLYYDLLRLRLRLTWRQLVNDVWRMLLLLLLLLLIRHWSRFRVGNDDLVMLLLLLLHPRRHRHIAQLLLHVLGNVDQQISTARLVMALRLALLVDDCGGVLVDCHRLLGHGVLDDDLLCVLRRRPTLLDDLGRHLDVGARMDLLAGRRVDRSRTGRLRRHRNSRFEDDLLLIAHRMLLLLLDVFACVRRLLLRHDLLSIQHMLFQRVWLG